MTASLKQLREVHAIQGRDGCWDIDDYMLGLYNGLELALSIVENRECLYKQRPKAKQMKGVRVEGDTVVISTKDNDAARELCGALIEEMNK